MYCVMGADACLQAELKDIDASKTDYLLGLFEHSHCRYNLDTIRENIEYKEHCGNGEQSH